MASFSYAGLSVNTTANTRQMTQQIANAARSAGQQAADAISKPVTDAATQSARKSAAAYTSQIRSAARGIGFELKAAWTTTEPARKAAASAAQAFTATAAKAASSIQQGLGRAWSSVSGAAGRAASAAASAWQRIPGSQYITSAFGRAWAAVSSAAGRAAAAAGEAWARLPGAQYITSAFGRAWAAVTSASGRAASAAGSAWSRLPGSVSGAITSGLGHAWDAVSSAAGRAAAAATSAWSRVGSTIAGQLGQVGKSVGKSLGSAGAVAAAGMGAVAASVIHTGVQYNTLAQTSQAAFKTILGSGRAATDMMTRIHDLASVEPFPRQAYISATQQMVSFGISAQKTIPYLKNLSDAVAATGGGAQDLSDLSLIMSQISAAGKITGVDLMQFAQRGINAADLIGSAMGKTSKQIKDEITAGSLDAGKALDALSRGMQQRYGGAAANVKKTWAGAMDSVKGAMRDTGSALVEPFISTGGGGMAITWANQFATLLRKGLLPHLAPLVSAFTTGLKPALGAITPMMNRLSAALKTADWPAITANVRRLAPAIVGVTAAVSALAGGALLKRIPGVGDAIGNLGDPIKKVGGFAVKSMASLGGIGKEAIGSAGKMDLLKGALKGFATPMGGLIALFGLMLAVSPELRRQLMNLGIQLLKALIPAFLSIVGAMRPLIPIIVMIAKMLASGIVVVVQALTPILVWLAKVIGKFGGILLVAAAAWWVLNVAMDANPFVLIALAVVALIGVIFKFRKQIVAGLLTAWRAVSDAMKAVWRWVTGTFTAMWRGLLGTVRTVWTAIKSAARTVWNAIKNVIMTPVNAVKNAILGAWNWVKDKVTYVWRLFRIAGRTQFTTMKNWIMTPVNAVKNGVHAAWIWVRDKITGIWNALKTVGRTAWTTMKNWIMTPVNALKTALHNAANWIHDKVLGVWNTIKTKSQSIWNGLVNGIHTIFLKVEGFIKTPLKWVVNHIINPVIEGINKLITKIGLPRIHWIKLGFAQGGKVPGSGRGDRVPAMLEPGETVVTRRDSRRSDFRAWAAQRGIPGYQQGGLVPGGPPVQIAPMFGWSDIWHGAVRIASGVGHFLREGVARAFELFTKPLRALAQPFVSSPQLFRQFMGKVVIKALDAAVNFIRGKEEPPLMAGGAGIVELTRQVMRRFPALSITSGFRRGDPGYHGKGMARDLGGPVAVMNAAARWITDHMTRLLLEGIHNPGLSVKNGKHVAPAFWGSATWAAHANHIHLAAQKDGTATGPAGYQRIVRSILGPWGALSATQAVMHRMQQESSFNPRIVNRWDENWQKGTPSVGLMQVIGPTFRAYAGRYRHRGPFLYGVSVDPLANIYAGLNYIRRSPSYRGRSLVSVLMQKGGYARGGIVREPVIGMGVRSGSPYSFGERGPEMVSPLRGQPAADVRAQRPVTINVYPQRGQSETEIAAAVSRRLSWATATGRA